ERQDHHADDDGGDNQPVGVGIDAAQGVGAHGAQAGHGGQHAHAQEGHEGLGEDGRRDLQAGGGHDLADAVGQQVPLDDPAAGGAQGAGGGDVLLLLQSEDLAADDAAQAHPV